GEPWLIAPEDLERPDASLLLRELRDSPDRRVWALTEMLVDAYRGPLSRVPPFAEVLRAEEAVRRVQAGRGGAATEREKPAPPRPPAGPEGSAKAPPTAQEVFTRPEMGLPQRNNLTAAEE